MGEFANFRRGVNDEEKRRMSSKLHRGDLNFDCAAGGAQPSRQAAIESAPQIPRQLGDLRDTPVDNPWRCVYSSGK